MSSFKQCECYPCKVYPKWPVLWSIGKNRKWYEIPKNGSFTIKQTYFGTVDPGPEIKYWNNPPEHNDTIIVVWRDPIDRFKSMFMHYFLEEGLRFDCMLNFFSERDVDLGKQCIPKRIELALSHLMEFGTNEECHHFYPQTWFINQTHIHKMQIIEVSELTTLMNVPVDNSTPKDREHLINFTKQQQEFIMDVYKEDYDFYNRIKKTK